MDRPDIEGIQWAMADHGQHPPPEAEVQALIAYVEHLEAEAENTAVARERGQESDEWQTIATALRTDLDRILLGSDPSGWPGAAAYDEKVGRS